MEDFPKLGGMLAKIWSLCKIAFRLSQNFFFFRLEAQAARAHHPHGAARENHRNKRGALQNEKHAAQIRAMFFR